MKIMTTPNPRGYPRASMREDIELRSREIHWSWDRLRRQKIWTDKAIEKFIAAKKLKAKVQAIIDTI
jgi:hypothetical protein